ncbi:MAG: hypothetical protein WC378_07240 [Opitutaceae bacterium]|jgi:hypothetical protein
MKTLWHIARKDILRFRWLILAWVAYQASVILLAVFALPGELDGDQTFFLQLYLDTSPVISSMMGWVLAILIVREDSLMESDVFWVTRPISGATLLLAKMLAIAVAVWLPPVLVGIPWWLYSGFGALDILKTSRHLVAQYFHVTALALCFAIFATRRRASTDLSGALALMIILAVCYPIVRFLLGRDLALLPFGLAASRLLLCDLVALIVTALMTVNQFLTRRKWRSAAIGVTGAGVILLLLHTWPGNFVAWSELAFIQPATIKGEFSTFLDRGNASAEIAQVQGKLILPACAMSTGSEVIQGFWNENGVSIPLKGRIQAVERNVGGEKRLLRQLAWRVISGESAGLIEQDSVLYLRACGELADGKLRSQKLPVASVREAFVEAVVSCGVLKGVVAGTLPLTRGGRLSSGATRTQLSVSVDNRWPFTYEIRESMPAHYSEGSEYIVREKSTGRVIKINREKHSSRRIHGVSIGTGFIALESSDILPAGVYLTDDSIRVRQKDLELVRVAFRETERQRLPLNLHLTSTSPATVTRK